MRAHRSQYFLHTLPPCTISKLQFRFLLNISFLFIFSSLTWFTHRVLPFRWMFRIGSKIAFKRSRRKQINREERHIKGICGEVGETETGKKWNCLFCFLNHSNFLSSSRQSIYPIIPTFTSPCLFFRMNYFPEGKVEFRLRYNFCIDVNIYPHSIISIRVRIVASLIKNAFLRLLLLFSLSNSIPKTSNKTNHVRDIHMQKSYVS